MRRIFLTQLQLVFIFLIPFKIYCQDKKDTIYFDEDWSICEKPVAEYYRVCTLDRGYFLYRGDVEDHFINGNIKMKGSYSIDGTKNGEFLFYNKNGFLIKKGNFLNNEMVGDWYFYNSIGVLKFEFFCRTSTDFIPTLIIDNNNDTLLKNGNGSFVLSLKEEPFVIPLNVAVTLEGSVNNNVKNGEYKYYDSTPERNLIYEEKYEDGRFIKARWQVYPFRSDWSKQASAMFALNDIDLVRIDLFNHSNIVFGSDKNGLQKLVNYLQYNIKPEIQPSGESSYLNDGICFFIIDKVLLDDFRKDSSGNSVYPFITDVNVSHIFYSKEIPYTQINTVKQLNGDIVINIDSSGKVIDCSFNTNLPTSDINKIDYYLQHVSNLAVKKINEQKTNRQLNLKLSTVIDTEKNNMAVVRYVLYDADSLKQSDIANNKSPQVEARFPGGQNAWQKFLEQNLDPTVPARHNAPNGNYTVTVSFMVDENGRVSDVQALNDPGYGTAKEAVRVIKKAVFWMPAIKDGKAVKYRQKQNITFQVTSN